MTDTLSVRQAVVGDMPTILAMIDEAADWLGTKGTDQWARPWPTTRGRDRRVRRGLRKNKTWIVEMDGVPIGTVTLRRRGNRRLWTAQERREPAVYLSRLVIRRDYAGQAIGEALIDWAGARAARDWGAHWVRIDVWTTNVALHDYYKKRGFRPYGDQRSAKINDYPSAALFQKPVVEIDETAAARFTEASGPGDRGSSRPFRTRHSRREPRVDDARGHVPRPWPESPGLAAAHRMGDRELAPEAPAG